MKIDFNETKKMSSGPIGNWQSYPIEHSRSYRFLKFLSGLSVAILIGLLIGYLTIRFFVGPVIRAVDNLPEDFPEELMLYKGDEAKIYLDNNASRKKILNLISILPSWLTDPILKRLTNDLQLKLAQNFGGQINIPDNFDFNDLKRVLGSVDLENIGTVSLSWDKLDKTKEELLTFYKQKLSEGNFEFKEDLSDYEINLGFWKNNIFGTIALKDKEREAGESEARVMVNYLK